MKKHFLLFDVMQGEKFLFQFKYAWNPIFKVDLEDVGKKLLEARPSLRDKKNIVIYQTEEMVCTH